MSNILISYFRRPLFYLGIVIFLLLGGFALKTFTTPQKNASILTDTVKRGNIELTINATGTLEPKQYVEVGAQVSGQVQRIHVDEGDIIKADQLLLDIDATVFETKVQNAEASLEGKHAQRQQLQAELELASLRARRNHSLFKKDAISEDTLFESAANEKILKAKIRAMEAQIKADTASLAGDKATLGYAKIFAPISGTVVSIAVKEGQTLNANQNAPLLLKIANLNQLTLRAEVTEADITRLKKGMPLYFQTFGGGKRRWHSKIRQVLPTPSVVNDVVLYQVLIDIDNRDGQLMDAMTTQVYFVRDSVSDALIIPLGAVQYRDGSPQVRVKVDHSFQWKAISLGLKNRTHTQVLSGLTEGDIVAIGSREKGAQGNAMIGGGPPRGMRRGF